MSHASHRQTLPRRRRNDGVGADAWSGCSGRNGDLSAGGDGRGQDPFRQRTGRRAGGSRTGPCDQP
ncbi:MAG TPA: hypothetical protein DCL95_18850, partial [Rhodospirillaceae bacterium]|nr:hypothetical protein [Rhodospirillaceae bacterium]